jgi:D-glycero-D-manno-heptose 1,7-bisphosphate phosphatase
MVQKATCRYVVLDRDGTLNVEHNYLSDPAQLELLPGVVDGLRLLQNHNFGLVVVSNQSGIGRGIVGRDAVERTNARLEELLCSQGIVLGGMYYCPHRPDEFCPCRKPSTAMLDQAARDLGFDPSESFVIGDKPSDVEMGHRAGAKTIVVLTGYGRTLNLKSPSPDFVAENLVEAATFVIQSVRNGTSQQLKYGPQTRQG